MSFLTYYPEERTMHTTTTTDDRDRYIMVRGAVLAWSRLHPELHHAYHAPYVMWQDALHAELIDAATFDFARVQCGRMWNYCGD